MEYVDLRSDTVTKPTSRMREAMAAAIVGDDVFEEDPTINELQDLAQEMLGKEKALFLPSGTMANQVAALCHTTPGQEVIVHTHSHIFNYEAGGLGRLGGLQVRVMAGEGEEFFSLKELEGAIRADNIHFPVTGMIALENTMNRQGGKVYSKEQLEAIYELAKKYKIPVHLDGARIFNAATTLGCDVKEISQYGDSVMFCLSKGLGAPVGSMLVGPASFIDKARRMRKLLGGGMRQAGILAAAGMIALKEMPPFLQKDHERARRLGEGLDSICGFSVNLEGVQSNIVVLDFSKKGIPIQDFMKKAKDLGVLVTPFGPFQARLVTHHDIHDDGIEKAIARLGDLK